MPNYIKKIELPSGDEYTISDERAITHALQTAVGSSTQPVYVNSAGEAIACTPYASASVNYATKASGATNSFTITNGSNTATFSLSGDTLTLSFT